MAAIRCSSVDLPEPEGPISATNSPLLIVIVQSFSATTWNSSRINSFFRWRVSITASGMHSSFLVPHFLAVFEDSAARTERCLPRQL